MSPPRRIPFADTTALALWINRLPAFSVIAPARVSRPLAWIAPSCTNLADCSSTFPPRPPSTEINASRSTETIPASARTATFPPRGVACSAVAAEMAWALTSELESIDTLPAWDSILIVPPKVLPSASVLLPAAKVKLPSAFNTKRPPSLTRLCARITPEWLKVPANTPTAPPLRVPRLMTWLFLFWIANVMSFRLRPVISTISPAASTMLPPSLVMTALPSTPIFGATK